MSTQSVGGAKFFVTFKDDYSGFRHAYFMRHKSDVYECFKRYEQMIRNQFNSPMKRLRADNGKEYINKEMKE